MNGHECAADTYFCRKNIEMKALVIKSSSNSEMKFLTELLNKLGMTSQVIDIDDIEDLGLSLLMKQADRSKKVSRETVLKKLRTK
jgi:hypothetical protein